MKTVMKKMFCLLLVAVLMAGALPFAAFAEECTAQSGCAASTHAAGCPEACTGDDSCTHVGVQHQAGCPKIPCDGTKNCGHTGTNHTPGCPKIPCDGTSNCGHTGTNHTPGCPKIPCTNSTSCDHTGNQHVSTCPLTCNGERDCPHTGVHHAATCASIPCDKTANCPHKSVYHDPDCLIVNPNAGSSNSGSSNSGSSNSGNSNSGNSNSGSSNSGSSNTSSGKSVVKVHVNLYTGNVLTDTVELMRYKDSSSTRIYSSIAKHEDEIRDELDAQYPGYSWSGNFYDDPKKAEATNVKIGNGTTVYINAYSDQDLVYIYVHNSRSMSNLRIIQLEGKKVGETITKKEVINAVSKYYSISTLSMYSDDAWLEYVNGESVESVSSLKINSDPFLIDVKISGSAKSTSGSGSTADSSNPKTGDVIFAPAMIMGLSASALAVIYYLNKKRAY